MMQILSSEKLKRSRFHWWLLLSVWFGHQGQLRKESSRFPENGELVPQFKISEFSRIFYNWVHHHPFLLNTRDVVSKVLLVAPLIFYPGRCTSLFLLASNATTKDLWTSTWASLPWSSIWKVRSCWSWKWVGIREVDRGPLNGSQLFVVKLQEGGSCHQHCRNVHHNWWHRLCGRSGLCQAKGWNSPCHLTCFTKRSIKPRYMRFSWCFQFSVYRI